MKRSVVPERKLNENFAKDRRIHGESNVWNTAKRQKRSTDLMFMFWLNETMDQLAMANRVRWYGHVLRSLNDHIYWRALDFEVESQRKKGRPKRTWKRKIEEESVKAGLRREDAL